MIVNTLKTFVLILFCSFASASHAAFEYAPNLHWKTLHTSHFEIHFNQTEESIAQEVADIAERTHIKLTDYFEWIPRAKTHIVISDEQDFFNGFASFLPANRMVIYVTPPDDLTSLLDNYSNSLETLIVHEYAHIVHLDKVTGAQRTLRSVFGRFDWLLLTPFPNAWQPPWIIEGIATYHESQIEPTSGRGNNNYFRGLMRNEVVNGIKPIWQVNQINSDWPVFSTRYLYGVYFQQFLQAEYGDEGIQRWIDDYSSNLIPFRINDSSRRAFGKPLADMWELFEDYLHQEFDQEIQQRRDQGLSIGTSLSTSGLLTGYPRSLANGDIFYVETYADKQTRLMHLKQGSSGAEVLTEVYGNQFDLHPEQGFLFAERDVQNNVRSISDLYRYDINTLKKTQLTKNQRYLAAAWHPQGKQIIALRNQAGNKQLDLLSHDGTFIQTLWKGENKENISSLQWSPNSEYLVASVWRNGNWNLEKFILDSQQWQTLTLTAGIEVQPVFSQDGLSLLFSADYDGVFNIYRFDLSSKVITQLTNVMGAAIAATEVGVTTDTVMPTEPKRLAIMSLGKQGFDVIVTDELTMVSKSLAVTKKTSSTKQVAHNDKAVNQQITRNTLDYRITDYHGWSDITPKSWFPYFDLEDEQSEWGFTTFGSDPLSRHRYFLLAAYDTKNDWAVGEVSYAYDRWNPTLKLNASREVFTVSDQQGSLAGADSDQLSAELVWPFLKRDRQWAAHFAYVQERDRLKLRLNPTVRNFDIKDERLGLALSFNSSKRYLRSISKVDGQQFRLVYEDSSVFDGFYDGKTTTADWRGYFRLSDQQVFATRLLYGRGSGNSKPFRLGGTTNGFFLETPGSANRSSTESIFDRRQYALRGYPSGLRALQSKNAAVVEAEWRFPLLRLERGFMAPPLGLTQLSGTVFYNAGTAWSESFESDDVRQGAGVELNAELLLGYQLGVNLRLGFAHGADAGGEDQVYLKLGQTF